MFSDNGGSMLVLINNKDIKIKPTYDLKLTNITKKSG